MDKKILNVRNFIVCIWKKKVDRGFLNLIKMLKVYMKLLIMVFEFESFLKILIIIIVDL